MTTSPQQPPATSRQQSGSVILMAIFVVFFASVLMISLELFRLSDLESATSHIREMQAYYCAEAGVEHYIYVVRSLAAFPSLTAAQTSPLYASTACTSGGAYPSIGTYRVQVSNGLADSTMTDFYHYVHIKSYGTAYNTTRVIQATLRRSWKGTPKDYQILRWHDL